MLDIAFLPRKMDSLDTSGWILFFVVPRGLSKRDVSPSGPDLKETNMSVPGTQRYHLPFRSEG